jgi:plastocyanin
MIRKTSQCLGWSAASAFGLAMLMSVGAAAQEPAAVVEMGDVAFMPDQVTVSVGDTVEWRNESGVTHTVTADPDLAADPANVELPEGAEAFDSGEVASGESFSYTFEQAGTYRYVCLPHERQGMLGTVVVE